MTDTGQSAPIVRVIPQDADWEAVFSAEISAVRSAIRPALAHTERVGSTAVPGLDGKPVIDLLITLKDWNDEPAVAISLVALGYQQENTNDTSQRRFFCKPTPSPSLEAIHLHLTPPDSEYGQDMMTFRDLLIGDKKTAEDYVALKKRLALEYPDDFDAYTNGKSDFIKRVLAEGAEAFGTDRLLTHQRAELNQAQRFENFALVSQFGVAVIAAVSVFFDDNDIQLTLAVIGFVIAFVWFALARKQRAHRSAGDQARRAVLLSSGLNEKVSAEQQLRIFDSFSVPLADVPDVLEVDYFASRAFPGYDRLAELIEESAYWTRDLQKVSANFLIATLILIAAIMLLAVGLGIPMLPAEGIISMARVLVAILVFLLTSNLIGAIFAHYEAASTISEILHRIEAAAARGHPAADVLLLMSDYNATVESAPLTLPGVFELRRPFLTKRWRNHLQSKRR